MQISKLTKKFKLICLAQPTGLTQITLKSSKKLLISGAIYCMCLTSIFSQQINVAHSMPDMPSISASSGPSMPTIVTPSLGTKFYTPKLNATYKSKDSDEDKKNSTGIASTANSTAANNSTGLSDLKGSLSTADELEALLGSAFLSQGRDANGKPTVLTGISNARNSENLSKVSVNVPAYQNNFSENGLSANNKKGLSNSYKNTLSALDLLSLNKKGLISNIYGLEEISGNQKNDEILLSSILGQLEALKARQQELEKALASGNGRKASAASYGENYSQNGNVLAGNQAGNLNQNYSSISNFSSTSTSSAMAGAVKYNSNTGSQKSDSALKNELVACSQSGASGNPQILRFNINGTNIIDSLRTVWFSRQENDGSFLVTGDRKYYEGAKLREETFYLLFKADGNGGSERGYNVEGKVMQDLHNENSLLYRLTQVSNLTADKTGNLITMTQNNENLRINLLIDSGN
ncbi:MAG: hypothetical protein K6E78_01295 [Treponema sp.]|nr:hypothetical protein [Treponema sp.]